MMAGVTTTTSSSPTVICRMCDNSSAGIERVAMPYVFRYGGVLEGSLCMLVRFSLPPALHIIYIDCMLLMVP
jgi:hypothetical protein